MSGENFTIFCNLTVPERLSTLPAVLWYESGNFDPLNGNGDKSIVVGNKIFIRPMLQTSFVIASFMFAPLRAADAQSYHCLAIFNHPIFRFATSPTKSIIATSELSDFKSLVTKTVHKSCSHDTYTFTFRAVI